MTAGKIQFAENEGTYVLKFLGEIRLTLCSSLESFLDNMFNDPDFSSVIIDLSETSTIDSTSLGILARLSIQAKKRFNLVPILISTQNDITRILLSMGFDSVFVLVREFDDLIKLPMNDLPCEDSTEPATQERVLNAHKVLMSLNEDNRKAFSELVKQLEKGKTSSDKDDKNDKDDKDDRNNDDKNKNDDSDS